MKKIPTLRHAHDSGYVSGYEDAHIGKGDPKVGKAWQMYGDTYDVLYYQNAIFELKLCLHRLVKFIEKTGLDEKSKTELANQALHIIKKYSNHDEVIRAKPLTPPTEQKTDL